MKTLFYVLVLITAPLVFAQEDDCSALHPELDDLLKMSKYIEWEAASINDVKNAHCMRKKIVTAEELVLKTNRLKI
jgi:hypothetical protein